MTILLLILSLAFAQEEYAPHLMDVKGEVTLYAGDTPEGVPAEKDTPLQPGDRIVTGADSSAEVFLDSDHLVVVREKSHLTIDSVSKSGLELTLTLGALLAKVQKLIAGQQFRVHTPVAVAAVRGTEFAVEVSEGALETYVGVFDEGKIDVTASGATETLLANQETSVARGKTPMPAFYLRRLERHRGFMRNRVRGRHAAFRKAWKALPPGERRALRQKRFELMQQRRKQRIEKMKDNGRAPAQRAPNREQQERLRKNKERMDKARERARQRRGQQP
jgi:hypothetical protein